jgi:DUF1707 SHOCT-like domain
MGTRYGQSRARGLSPMSRGSGSDQHLRVSDAGRQAVTGRLSRHFGDGRLDQADFGERSRPGSSGIPGQASTANLRRSPESRPSHTAAAAFRAGAFPGGHAPISPPSPVPGRGRARASVPGRVQAGKARRTPRARRPRSRRPSPGTDRAHTNLAALARCTRSHPRPGTSPASGSARRVRTARYRPRWQEHPGRCPQACHGCQGASRPPPSRREPPDFAENSPVPYLQDNS